MRKRYAVLLLNFIFAFSFCGPSWADNFSVAVKVYCNDTFTQELIKGYILRELRNVQGVTIIEKGKVPQVELSIVGAKTDNNWIALSIMKVQHLWSQRIDPSTGKQDYRIGRADHYVAILPMAQVKTNLF